MNILPKEIWIYLSMTPFLSLPLHVQIVIVVACIFVANLCIRSIIKTIFFCLTVWRMSDKERLELFHHRSFKEMVGGKND